MKSYIQHGPFAGVVVSLDPEMIPENAAADLRNVTVEDGRITPRYGYRNLSSPAADIPNRVQEAHTGPSNSTASSMTVTLGTTPVQGNCLVLAISCDSVIVSSVASSGATWIKAIQQGSAFNDAEIWYAPNLPAGTGKTITITFVSAVSYYNFCDVFEYNGLAISPLDTTCFNIDQTGVDQTGTAAATGTNEVAIALITQQSGVGAISLTAATNGFTVVTQGTAQSGGYAAACLEKLGVSGNVGTQMTTNLTADTANVLALFKAAPTAIPYGFDYVQGFGGSNQMVEEYVAFTGEGGPVTPFSVNVSTGAFTQLTNGGSSIYLSVPSYGDQPGIKSFSFNNNAYVISNADSPTLYRHQIGTDNSFTPMNPPSAPTKAPLAIMQQYRTDGNVQQSTVSAGATSATQAMTSTAGYAVGQWVYFETAQVYALVTAVGASTITVSHSVATVTGEIVQIQLGRMPWDNGVSGGIASSALSTSAGDLTAVSGVLSLNGYLTMNGATVGTVTSPLDETFTINLTATNGPGQQDFTYVDRVMFTVASGALGLTPDQFSVVLTNAAGTTFEGVITDARLQDVSGAVTPSWLIIADFAFKDPRSDYSTIQKITIGWQVTSNDGIASEPITVSPLWLGQVNVTPVTDDGSGDTVNLLVGYTYYNVSTGLESQISPTVSLTPAQLQGPAFVDSYTNASYYLSARPKLYLTADGGSDCYRIYARRSTDTNWFLVQDFGVSATSQLGLVSAGATASGGTSKTVNGVTYDASVNLRCNWNELSQSSIFTLGASVFSGLISACAYKGWVVWGFRGGFSNLQHSQIGSELALFNNSDLTQLTPANTAAPANFTLADNGSDDPVAMFPVDQSLIILGEHGAYAQSGYSPTTMSPPYKLPTALGCCGQFACCLWHDEIGNPGVAFVSKQGEGIYMAQQDLYYLNETHYKIVELSDQVRGAIASFLTAGGNLSQVRMWADHTRDSLWVACGANAMVLRRPSLIDQARHWEFYTYTFSDSSSIGFVASDTRNRVRWIRMSGSVDENEWNSSSLAWISGTGSDGGNALSPLYYTCRTVTNPERTRVRFVRVDRASLSDTPCVTVASTRETVSKVVGSGLLNVRLGPLQQGKEHQVTISPADGSGAIKRVLVELEGPLGDRWFE
jgi:hypothetical protein